MKASKILSGLGKWMSFILILVVFVLLFSIYWQVTKGDSADYAALKQAINQYGNDINELREELLLPQHDYNFFAAGSVSEEVADQTQTDSTHLEAVMKFAEMLAQGKEQIKKREEAKRLLEEMLREPRFASELKNLNLTFNKQLENDETYTRLKILSGRNVIAQLAVSNAEPEFVMQSIIGAEKMNIPAESTLRDAVISYLTKNSETILRMQTDIPKQQNAIAALWQDAELQDLLKKNSLILKSEAVETEFGYEFYLTDLDGSPLLTLTLDRKTAHFKIKENKYSGVDELKPALITALRTLNGQTENVKEIQNKKSELEQYLKSEGFLKSLKASGLKVAEVREEGDRVYYDLVFGDVQNEEKLGSIIFELPTGAVFFLNQADQTELSLEEVLTGSKKKF